MIKLEKMINSKGVVSSLWEFDNVETALNFWQAHFFQDNKPAFIHIPGKPKQSARRLWRSKL